MQSFTLADPSISENKELYESLTADYADFCEHICDDSEAETMEWVTPLFKRGRVDAAGRALVSPNTEYDKFEESLAIINNWRSAHSRPLYTFRFGLRRYAERIDPNVLVAQRIKRLSSIISKLELRPSMRLSQMQDIGGCRAVVNSVKSVQALHARYKISEIKHKLVSTDDYISTPKISGYRSLHLVYSYFSDRKQTHNGLKIEVQIRSQLQHAWATAVETVGTFIRQALKSSIGEEDWLRFFALMGTALAEREESPPVPGTPVEPVELRNTLRAFANRLDVCARLQAYGEALHNIETLTADSDYYLLELDPSAMQIKVTGFKQRELTEATMQYLAVEKNIKGSNRDAVLVSVDSMTSLRRAYPNYFLDTNLFVEAVNQAIA
ncbi:MAG: RelA/SpoT domain-containing protein [Terracidiphilus sp.]